MHVSEFWIGDLVEIGYSGGKVLGEIKEITDDYLVVDGLGFPIEDIEWIELVS